MKESIRLKLANGPLTIRELCRRFHSLTKGPCEELLLELETSRDAVLIDRKWRLAEPAPVATRTLALEV